MKNVTFHGVSGLVQLDEAGDRYNDGEAMPRQIACVFLLCHSNSAIRPLINSNIILLLSAYSGKASSRYLRMMRSIFCLHLESA